MITPELIDFGILSLNLNNMLSSRITVLDHYTDLKELIAIGLKQIASAYNDQDKPPIDLVFMEQEAERLLKHLIFNSVVQNPTSIEELN